MKNPFKKKPKFKSTESQRYVQAMLPNPVCQVSETLYYLMMNYKKGMSRLDLMNASGILNPPECIRILRHKHNVGIRTDRIKWINKHGRNVNYGNYVLLDFKKADEVYRKLVKK